MPYFFSDKNLFLAGTLELAGEEARHILLANRAKKGEKIKLQGPDGKRFLCQILSADKKSLKVEVLEQLVPPDQPRVNVVLFLAVISEKALDFVFQKGTELGLSKIVLFNSANTATKLSVGVFEKKKIRWEKILKEAAKQCERQTWPDLLFEERLDQVMAGLPVFDKVFLADIDGEKINFGQSLSGAKTCAVVVGPEGGLLEVEVLKLKTLPNLQTLNLGPVLLRAETAVITLLALLNPLLY